MKKIILLSLACIAISSCSTLLSDKPTKPLYVNDRAPGLQDINFNKDGTLPEDIKNQSYYNTIVEGSAIEGCDVFDYGVKRITEQGKNVTFIGDATDWDVERINCQAGKGNGKKGETYNLKIQVFTDKNIYETSTTIVHQ